MSGREGVGVGTECQRRNVVAGRTVIEKSAKSSGSLPSELDSVQQRSSIAVSRVERSTARLGPHRSA